MRGNYSHKKRQKKANGGLIRGPGTGTSDDIDMLVEEGSYIMPADSTAQLGVGPLAQMGSEQMPISVSNGEYQMPPEQVHAVGVQALDEMRDQTHMPVAQNRQQNPQQTFFADGGAVFDPERRIYVDSAGRAVQSAGVPSQSSAMATAPQYNAPPSGPALASGSPTGQSSGQATGGRVPPMDRDFRVRAEAMHRAKRDTAGYESQRAAMDKKFADANKPRSAGGVRGLVDDVRGMPRGMRSAGALGTALSAAPEALDVAAVARDPESTGLDVATQSAEGISKVAGGTAGALLGAQIGLGGGPAAPFTVPAGAAIGGALGYALPGQITRFGRWATGQDTESPIDRTQARQSQAQIEPEESAPQGDFYGTQPASPAQNPRSNDITRVGNSFSGGNIGAGYTINGEPSSEADPLMYHAENASLAAAQNRLAKQNLFANTPGWAGGNQPIPSAGGVSGLNATSAPSGGGGGGGGVAQLIRNSGTPSNAEILRERMRGERTAQTQRGQQIAGDQNLRQQQVDIQRGAADAQQQAQQIERATALRTASRMEALRERYEQAKTLEERQAIALAIRDLLGQARPEYQIARSDRLADPSNPDSQRLSESFIIDPATGQPTPIRAPLPPLDQNPQVQQILANRTLSRDQRAQQIRALGYN